MGISLSLYRTARKAEAATFFSASFATVTPNCFNLCFEEYETFRTLDQKVSYALSLHN